MSVRAARRRSRVLLVAAVAVAVAVSALFAGSGAARGATAGTLIPPPTVPGGGLIMPPPPGYQFMTFSDYGAFTYTKATAAKADTVIRLPLELFHTYITAGLTSDFKYFDNGAALWVLSPAGVAQRYGIFQPVTVSTLAFGAIPVTATVRLSQLFLPNGQLAPLTLRQRTVQGSVNQYYPPKVTGQLKLQLTDVSVDQVPLNVGSRCQTASPVTISLVAKSAAAYPDPVKGGTLVGTSTIPAFSGCRTPSGEDLSRLFTGMLSGPDNPMVISQGFAGTWQYPEGCPLSDDPNFGCKIPPQPK